ncbi:MAG: phosphoribosylformylglycinamidine cyclo-ligase [Phycisphaerales bacterium]
MPPSTKTTPERPARSITYADAGIDLTRKDSFTESLDTLMRRTHTRRVIPNPGGFAGLVRLDYNEKLFRRNYKEPVLVACTDGVGTKVKLAAAVGDWSTIGIDCVAMNVNDMIVQGAEPLLFLDYLGVHRVDPGVLTDVVRGVAEGCRIAGCSLIGGETAEMPDVYPPGELDLAGFAVGVVELERAINPLRVKPGDVVLGLGSDGVHSNGYTLVRRIVAEAGLDLGVVYEELGETKRRRDVETKKRKELSTLGRVLLTPTRIYVGPIVKLQRDYKVKKVISGMAHITGSGLAGNLCRALNPKVDAVIDTGSWPVPPVFTFLQKHGGVPDDEMRRVFNMGIGYCLIVRPDFADSIAQRLRKLGERVYAIGKVVKGRGEVREE